MYLSDVNYNITNQSFGVVAKSLSLEKKFLLNVMVVIPEVGYVPVGSLY